MGCMTETLEFQWGQELSLLQIIQTSLISSGYQGQSDQSARLTTHLKLMSSPRKCGTIHHYIIQFPYFIALPSSFNVPQFKVLSHWITNLKYPTSITVMLNFPPLTIFVIFVNKHSTPHRNLTWIFQLMCSFF